MSASQTPEQIAEHLLYDEGPMSMLIGSIKLRKQDVSNIGNQLAQLMPDLAENATLKAQLAEADERDVATERQLAERTEQWRISEHLRKRTEAQRDALQKRVKELEAQLETRS